MTRNLGGQGAAGSPMIWLPESSGLNIRIETGTKSSPLRLAYPKGISPLAAEGVAHR